MIIPINKMNAADIEFAWRLSQRAETASYPRLASYEAVEAVFEKLSLKDTAEMIVLEEEGHLQGLCAYFWIEADRYLQTTLFLVSEGADYRLVADSMVNFLKDRFATYTLYLGFPLDNQWAHSYFVKRSDLQSLDYNTVMQWKHSEAYPYPDQQGIERVTEINFEEYAPFHDRFALEEGIYWTSERLVKALDRFVIFCLRREGKILASLFGIYKSLNPEIFGIYVDPSEADLAIEDRLLRTFLAFVSHQSPKMECLYYFLEGDRDENAARIARLESLGFRWKEDYFLAVLDPERPC